MIIIKIFSKTSTIFIVEKCGMKLVRNNIYGNIFMDNNRHTVYLFKLSFDSLILDNSCVKRENYRVIIYLVEDRIVCADGVN